MKENRVEKILGMAFLGIGILLVGVALVCAIFSVRFQRGAQKVTGVITEIYGNSIEVSYTYHDRLYETPVSEYSSSMREGDSIKLYVSQDNPEHVRTEMLLFLPSLIFGIVGLPILIVGAVFLIILKSKKRKKQMLLKNGKAVDAVVTGGQKNYNLTVNGKHPWKLECKYEDIYSGETYLYSSYNVWKDPALYIGQNVRVYVDRNNPKKYYVDVDSLRTEQNGSRVFDYR